MSLERAAFSAAVGLAIGLAAALGFRYQPEIPLTQSFRLPRTPHPPVVDSRADDGGWDRRVVRRIFFGADRKPYSPQTEARFAHDGEKLYGAVFASDRDVRSRGPAQDGVHFTMTSGVTQRDFAITLDGKIGNADGRFIKGTKVAVRAHGTVDNPIDDDKDWAIEFAIPLELLGIDRATGSVLEVTGERCDAPKDGPRTCGELGERGHPIRFTLE